MRDGWTRWGFLELLFSYLHCPSTIFARFDCSRLIWNTFGTLTKIWGMFKCFQIRTWIDAKLQGYKDAKTSSDRCLCIVLDTIYAPKARCQCDFPASPSPALIASLSHKPICAYCMLTMAVTSKGKNIVEKRLSIIRTQSFFPSVQTERKKKSERKKQINFSSNYVYARAGLAREREREREWESEREGKRELASTCHTLHTARDKTTLVPFREKKEKTRVGSRQEVLKPEEILHLD